MATRRTLLCLSITVVILVILAVAGIFISNSIVCNKQWKPPIFQVHDFSVTGLAMLANFHLEATWEANLIVTNPTRNVKLQLKEMQAFIYTISTDNSTSPVIASEGVSLGPGEVASINLRSEPVGSGGDDGAVERCLRPPSEDNNGTTVIFGVEMRGLVRVSYIWHGLSRWLSVRCDGLEVGSFDQPKPCGVDIIDA